MLNFGIILHSLGILWVKFNLPENTIYITASKTRKNIKNVPGNLSQNLSEFGVHDYLLLNDNNLLIIS